MKHENKNCSNSVSVAGCIIIYRAAKNSFMKNSETILNT